MKLLMTADTIGGVWTYAIDLIRALSRRNVRVHLVTLGRQPSPAQQRVMASIAGLTVTATDYRLEWMHEPWRDVDATVALLRRLVEVERPDLVHFNQFCYDATRWDVPVIVVGHSCVMTWMHAVRESHHDRQWTQYRQRVQEGIRHADCFIAPTAAMLDAFAHCYDVHTQAQAIHNGRDASCFAPAPKRRFIFAAGRVWDEAKNLASLDIVAPRFKWPVLIAGAMDGPDGQVMHPRHVRALGPLEPARLARYMGWASIYALPARYEPFGLSAVEAAHSGCALVLGDIPTLREVWADAAIYVDPADPSQLQHAINRLIEHPHERAHYARAAQRRARRYTAARMAERYLTVYDRLSETRRSTATSVEETA